MFQFFFLTHPYEIILFMNDVEKLHTAIRRYCMDRHFYWTGKYSELNSSGKGFTFGNGYSEEALATFPRYNVLNAILTEIERCKPSDFSSIESAREFFCLVTKEAESVFTKPPNAEISEKVMAEERELLGEYIKRLDEAELSKVEPLPYRRVLSENESNFIRQKLKEIWGVSKGYWYPLTTEEVDEAEAFQDSYFEKEFGFEKLRELLRRRNVKNVWELREDDINYEIELNIFEPYYSGAEGFWCDENFDWLIYASHESSLTIAGSILPEVKNLWENWENRIWTTPFF